MDALSRLSLYVKERGLLPTLCAVIKRPRHDLSRDQYSALYRKGLILESRPGQYELRCPLYQTYFRELCA